MTQSFLSTDVLLHELRKLGLLSHQQTDLFASYSPSRLCADQLTAARLLTEYQVEEVLAGRGRALYVGPYLLRQRFGRGGMGHVFQAEHRLTKRLVALKIVGQVHREGGDLTALRRFRREVEAASRLDHPGVLAVHDAGEAHGRLYFVMEYVAGVDLEQYVLDKGPMSIALACRIVRQTAEVLYHTHERGLIHRDVKPSNLLFVPPDGHVKLVDFGLAHFADEATSAEEAAQHLCGTPDFMAPEWGRTDRAIDARSDLYSLGCTFYYLLTGQTPYAGGSWTEKLLRHHFEAPPSLQELRPDVPAEIVTVVERLMAREREDRYLSAAAVASALRCPQSAIRNPLSADDPPHEKKIKIAKVRRFSYAALSAMLLGVAAAGGARWMTTTTPSVAPPIPLPKAASFAIVNRGVGFASLQTAIAAAHDGDVIALYGAGPFVTPPLTWHGKALTLRGEGASRPRLVMKTADDPWQSLLRTDRTLHLEGLELTTAAHSPDAALIHGEGASLYLSNCKLTGGTRATAIVARNPPEIVLRNCVIETGAVGLSVEVGKQRECRIRMMDNRMEVRGESGVGLSFWAPEIRSATALRLELEGNTIRAARTTALRDLPISPMVTGSDRLRLGLELR